MARRDTAAETCPPRSKRLAMAAIGRPSSGPLASGKFDHIVSISVHTNVIGLARTGHRQPMSDPETGDDQLRLTNEKPLK
ncbi:MAG: hypothetical protein MI824_12055 [Hyphomicrobiales bacterium]|nr:hypothetical protein [Hyphomicrobiales bacterium]